MPLQSLSDLRSVAGATRRRAAFTLGQWGFQHSERRLTDDASRYWRRDADDRWQNHSHWCSGSEFSDKGRWTSIGQEHVRLYERLSRTAHDAESVGRVVDWGCGGGANSVAFASRATEIIGVDVDDRSLQEAERQVERVSGRPFTKVLVELEAPEKGIEQIPPRTCDLFLCLYVLELVPTPAYGLRLMAIAHRLLRPGGEAFVQIKYSTDSWWTRPRRRNYGSDIAGTTYRVDEFWSAMTQLGFQPETMCLVPRNELDERYAYFVLRRP